MQVARQPSPVQNLTDQKAHENVQYIQYLCSLMTKNAKYVSEIKLSIFITKQLSKWPALYTCKLGSSLRKKPVTGNMWSTAFCGAETETLGKVGQNT